MPGAGYYRVMFHVAEVIGALERADCSVELIPCLLAF